MKKSINLKAVRRLAALMLTAFTLHQAAASTSLVIAEAYGGGGNASGTYQNDYVVVYNPTASGVDVNGWSVQQASQAGSTWAVTTLASGSKIIPAGGYFLVKWASAGAVGALLPTADATNTAVNLAAGSGKIAICNSTTALTGTCPTGGSVIDFIGFGSTVNCSETSPISPVPSNNTTSVQRKNGGCTDTDNNSSDFTVAAPNPRNSASPTQSCGGGGAVGIVSQPQSRTNSVGTTATFTVSASGSSPAFQWQRSSTNLSNDGHFYNVTTSTLTISNVAFGDAGNYTCFITNAAPSTTNTDIATLTVLDASAVFTITTVARTNTLAATPVDVVFNFVGNAYAITNVTATSGNLTLVQNGNLVISGSGNSRTVQITPTAGASGVATITLLATAGGYTATSSLPVVVVPSSAVLMNDYFDYPDGSITAGSGGLWKNQSGPVNQMIATNGALYVSRALDEDCFVQLIGQPYASSSGLTLYSSFKVSFSEAPTRIGEYFAHFKDSGTSYRCRVWASATNAASGFRLGVGNTSGDTNTTGQVAQDLALGTTYTVVTRFVLSSGASTIWINPVNEASPSVTASDTPSPITVVSYQLRQPGIGIGKMTVDNLIVGTNFASVLPVTAPVLHAANDTAGLILTWSNPAYFLQAAPTLTNTFVAVCPSSSPYTNAITGTEQYFRLTTTPCP